LSLEKKKHYFIVLVNSTRCLTLIGKPNILHLRYCI